MGSEMCIRDSAKWSRDFGENALSDADDDGDSDGADFLAWQQQFGSPASIAAERAVPEPAAAWLALIAASAISLRRGRMVKLAPGQ